MINNGNSLGEGEDVESWVVISGLGDFSVSSFGRVISNISKNNRNGSDFLVGCDIPQFISKSGYFRVGLTNYETNIRKTFSVHRLVANAFIPNPENKPQVNHIDGDKENNRVENLEWVTAKENKHHSITTGLQKYSYGDNRNDTKIPDVSLPEIYKLYFKDFKTCKEITKYFQGVTSEHISQLVRGKRRVETFNSYYKENEDYMKKVIPILKKRNGVNQHIVMEKLKNATSN